MFLTNIVAPSICFVLQFFFTCTHSYAKDLSFVHKSSQTSHTSSVRDRFNSTKLTVYHLDNEEQPVRWKRNRFFDVKSFPSSSFLFSRNPVRSVTGTKGAIIKKFVPRVAPSSWLRWGDDGRGQATSMISDEIGGAHLSWEVNGESDTDLLSNLAVEDDCFKSFEKLPIATRNVLRQATILYTQQHGNDGNNAHRGNYQKLREDILDMLRVEYEFEYEHFVSDDEAVIMEIGNCTFTTYRDFRQGVVKEVHMDAEVRNQPDFISLLMEVISIGVIHRLPSEIVLELIKAMKSSPSNGIGTTVSTQHTVEGRKLDVNESVMHYFRSNGWSSVIFTRGLPIKLKTNFNDPNRFPFGQRQRQRLLPKSFTHRRHARAAYNRILDLSKMSPLKPMKKDEILTSTDELSGISQSLFALSEVPKRVMPTTETDDLDFFPKELRPWARFWEYQREKITGLVRAILLSYGIFNLLWYTVALTLSWRQFPASLSRGDREFVELVLCGQFDALRFSLRKFARLLVIVHARSQMTKLFQVSIAILLVPITKRILWHTQQRYNVSASRAFWIATSTLVSSSLGLWATIVMGDAFFSSFGKPSIRGSACTPMPFTDVPLWC